MKTIRGSLLAPLLVGLAVVLVGGGTAIFTIARANLMREFDAGLASRVRTLASLVTLEGRALTFDAGDASRLIGDTYYELHTESGELLRRSENLDGVALPMIEPSADASDDSALRFGAAALPEERDGRVAWMVFRPRVESDADEEIEDDDDAAMVPSSARAPERLIAVAALDRGPIDRALAGLLAALVAVGAVVAVTATLVVALGVRWGLRPLDRLGAQVSSVGARTMDRRLDGDGAPAELVPIYRELNSMLDRVEQMLERERSFVDAAAHELRTPLAELRSTAEIAIRWPEPERVERSLRELLAIGGEMERLVESLLLVSRADARERAKASGDVAVGPILRHSLLRVDDAVRAKALQIDVEVEDADALRAPRDALEIIIRNLIDNAVQYTPQNGRIAVAADATNGWRSFSVENGPVRLGDEEVRRLFEPFWRLDGSRSDRAHVGLGLTVVHRIANVIGLEVDAELRGDRLRIRVAG